MSRTAFIVAAAAGALLLQVATSDAQSKSKSKANSAEQARAESRDPGGNYRNYPTWARFALGGGQSRSR